MKLFKLLKDVEFELLSGKIDEEILGLDDNSKNCKTGSLFFAIRGTNNNGEEFIEEAMNNGATAVVVENRLEIAGFCENLTIILVKSVRKAIGIIAKNFYCPNGYKFKIIGITGTNGKTTTSFIIAGGLELKKYNVCIVGTSGIFVNGRCLRGEALTTPDPIELQSLFGFLNSINVDYVVMEVSAHALDLEKTRGVVFDYAIFSNLTEDHLDYFKNMKAYGEAKAKLFSVSKSKISIINTSDDLGLIIADTRKNNVITYGETVCDYKIDKISNNSFILAHNNKKNKLKLNISGLYNMYNATSALIVLMQEGLKIAEVKKYFKHLKIVEGRYNEFNINGHGKVVLDFAHTPDGLEKVLINARENMDSNGKLISVFGCGGNRDAKKRAIMGKISAKIADYTIISIDNPRFESPVKVMADIEKGVNEIEGAQYEIILPRANAVSRAINMSEVGDVVVVSGKGTEPYYEVNGKKEFYREDIVIECIKKVLER